MKHLFFDDEKLFGRENVRRVYGTPQLEAVYTDGAVSTDYFSPWVFPCADGLTRMIYYGTHITSGKKACLIAVSKDGIHFTPEDTTDRVILKDRIAPHELFKLGASGNEIADIYEDSRAEPAQRYKMLVCAMDAPKLEMKNLLYTSPDLYNWTLQPVNWGVGNEPIGDVLYNSRRDCHTILLRPFWGIRRSGYTETADWHHFSPFVPCMQQDSLDAPLTEIYGMTAIEYGGMFIGFPHLYDNLRSSHSAKFFGDDMSTQLAYSYEGRYWLRSLREPFLDGKTASSALGYENRMVWLTEAKPQPNGSILLYAAASQLEHGPAFRKAGTGRLHIYRLRQDGFIGLTSENTAEPAFVTTREKIWHGGELTVNLQAKHATLAVWEADRSENTGENVLGISHPVDGLSHEDCIPFSGSDTAWTPTFKSGKTLTELAGKVLIFEIRFTDGTLWSLEGDFTNVHNTQAARYRALGLLPQAWT